MNGYFRILNEEEQTSVMLYPADKNGEQLDINEVINYLGFRGISYDLSALYAAAKKLRDEPLQVRLHEGKGMPEQEMMKIKISNDNMAAYVRFYAPSNDGAVMDRSEILNDLKYRGVVFGIMEDALDAFLRKREYCKEFQIAQGQESKCGEDGKIDFQFNVDSRIKPTLLADGSVDFFHLNTINNCSEGDLLAKLIPPKPAVPGTNVKGQNIPIAEPKAKTLRYGKNVRISEDGNEIYSMVNGHIELEGEKVSVSDVLTLTNVDNSTGDIDYFGSVQISGNVCENFTVKAGGDVVVDGVVEGAVINAGGNVIIARGMNGMGKGSIQAGGNVVSKFFENATVHSGGYVASDSIMHSTVTARDTVNVSGRRGNIIGGRVCAACGIEVKNLGAAMGGDTVVEVGVDPTVKKRAMDLQKEIMENTQRIKRAQPVLSTAVEKLKKGIKLPEDQVLYIKNLNKMYNEKKKEIEEAGAELEILNRQIEVGSNAAVKVHEDVYAGTRIVIGDISMVVKSNVCHCRFVSERGEVKMQSF